MKSFMNEGQIKKGYKQVKLGNEEIEIPVEWRRIKIKNISEVVTGNTPSTRNAQFWGDEYAWITPTDINTTKDINSSARKLSSRGYDISRKLPIDTLLITCIASIGKNAILKANGSCNQQINAIFPSKNHSTDYLYYLLETLKRYLINISGTTAVPIINKSTFENIYLHLPPLPEQKKIAQILTSIDDYIESTSKVIEQTKKVKQGLLQELLTKGIGHKEFKKVKLGNEEIEIPVEWKIVKAENEINLLSGQHILEEDYNTEGNGIPYLTGPADFPNKCIQITKFTLRPKTLCNVNDTLITVKGSGAGSIVLSNGKYCISRQLMAINTKKMDYSFIYYIFLNKEKYYSESALGLIPGISRTDILKMDLLIPPLEEQKKIAQILTSIDNQIESLENENKQLQAVKKGLMQDLLTGKVRVKAS